MLLGFGLTALFAYATTALRTRVEDQLLAESLNRNIDAYADAFRRDPNNATFSFEGVKGWVFARDKLANAPPEWRALPEGIHELQGVENGERFAYKLAVRHSPDHAFYLAYDLTQTLQGQQQLNRVLLAAVVVFSALSLVLGWWSAARVMAPVSELARRLRRSGASSDPESLAPHFPEDEVGELAKALDDYASRLTDVVQRDREFNADVSHELRTPLMVISTSCELLLENQLHDGQREQIERITRAARDMNDLVRTFLMLARSDPADGAEADTVTLADVAREQAEFWESAIRAKGLDFELIDEGADTARHNPTFLRTVMTNLLRNALHYTARGAVRLVLEHDGFRIEDTGMGIPAPEQERIFQPFVRGSAARGEGLGLGLSLVKRICEHNGWNICATSHQHAGACFKVTFRFPCDCGKQ